MEPSEESLDDLIAKEARRLFDGIVDELYDGIKNDAPRYLADSRKFRSGFEARLRRRWKRALDLFDLTADLAVRAGANFNDKHRAQAEMDNDHVFHVLCRLHARACLTTSEVRALLHSGHATGAMTRWRTLHELAVVSFFVKEQGHDVAERYLLHEVIESAKSAEEYQRLADALGNEPLAPEELANHRSRKAELIARYGAPFGEPYGWAASALNNRRPSFADIEQAVQLGHARGYYRMASYGVHSHAKGSYFDLGRMASSSRHSTVLIAGPSNAGLADPADRTLFSLFQCTVTLLNTQPGLETVPTLLVIGRLYDEASTSFVTAHHKLREDEERIAKEEAAHQGVPQLEIGDG